MNRRRLRGALELAREVIEVQVEEIELLTAERDRLRARVATLEADPRAGLLEDVAERLGLPRPADERVVAAVVELIERVATLEAGIRGLWGVWMDDDASWVEVAGTLDELHTSLDVAGDDHERGRGQGGYDDVCEGPSPPSTFHRYAPHPDCPECGHKCVAGGDRDDG